MILYRNFDITDVEWEWEDDENYTCGTLKFDTGNRAFRLRKKDGEIISEVLITVDDQDAWVRCDESLGIWIDIAFDYLEESDEEDETEIDFNVRWPLYFEEEDD